MVKSRTAAPSRAATAASSRGTSIAARDVIKKRDKPYKTEQQTVMSKKKKLDLHTSYRKAPQGYTFLAVGTPELADLCKNMSRVRGYPVNVVNSAPRNRFAMDPTSLSHHVHRIGYHFRSEILEEACTELGYTMFRDRFVKEEDIAKEYEQTRMQQILLKHGMRVEGSAVQETPAQIHAAIKELFPKIPEADLEGIADYAWKDGTDRVGNVMHLDLSRRVQLAVIARIRHKYTDYDRLLRAFEWREARTITEPICLRKLIEWRGEEDNEDDGKLEEIVRETIIIDDDDDDDAGNGSEADDENSVIEIEDDSDTSIQVTHHLADDTDIGAESAYEGPKHLPGLVRQAPRRSKRLNELNKSIATARKQIQQRGVAPRLQPAFGSQHQSTGYPQSNIASSQNVRFIQHQPPATIEQDGIVYRRVPEHDAPTTQPPLAPGQWQPQNSHVQQGQFHRDRTPTSNHASSLSTPANGFATYDRPIMSIERDAAEQKRQATDSRDEPVSTYASTHVGHANLHGEHSAKRRRINARSSRSPVFRGVRPPARAPRAERARDFTPPNGEIIDLSTPELPRRQVANGFSGGVVDLTSPVRTYHQVLQQNDGESVNLITPEPPYRPVHPSSLREVENAPSAYGFGEPLRFYELSPEESIVRPAAHTPSNMPTMPSTYGTYGDTDENAYDPRQPFLQLPQQVDRLHIQPEQRQPYDTDRHDQYAPPADRMYYDAPPQPAYTQPPPQRMYAYPPAAPTQVFYERHPSHATPQPIHGAPAPVQQVPRNPPRFYQVPQHGRAPTVPPPAPPADGAPHPAQYYQRR